MTDVLETREGVTNPLEVMLSAPFVPSIRTRVARFGIEYEMLPSEDEDPYVDNDDVWSEDHSECNCESCLQDRIDAEYDRRREEGSGDAEELIRLAHRNGLIRDPHKHAYHCSCLTCSPTRNGHIFTAQSDCSVGVEFVSRIIDLNHFDDDANLIAEWVNTMQQWKRNGGWMPDGHESCGNHIHVSKSGMDDGGDAFTGGQIILAHQHINALYAAYDWTDVADGGTGRIRSYNSKPSKGAGNGSWLSDRGYGTMEHRLWNTPSDPERLWAHIGLSVALTRWAFALVLHDPTFNFWEGVSRWGDPTMTDETYFALRDNIHRVCTAIAQYIPDRPEFTIAHDVLGNLAPS